MTIIISIIYITGFIALALQVKHDRKEYFKHNRR